VRILKTSEAATLPSVGPTTLRGAAPGIRRKAAS
jgi:hypothetical protein